MNCLKIKFIYDLYKVLLKKIIIINIIKNFITM